MDTAAILVKIVGLVLFLFTARSVYRHVKGRMAKSAAAKAGVATGAGDGDGAENGGGKPEPQTTHPQHPQHNSKVEHALNTFLLYIWFVFMTALSLGMIINN